MIVECWDDQDIANYLQECDVHSEEEALDAFAPLIDVWSDRQADARHHEGRDA